MMKHLTERWRTFGLLVLAAFAVAGCGGGGGGGESESLDNVVWGTSSQGSPPYTMSVAMADIVTQETGIAVTVQSTGGSEATVQAIDDGNTHIGLVNTFAADNGFNGEPPFEQPVDLRLQIWGYDDIRQLVVRADSGIESPADLEGKRIVGDRPALAEIRMTTDAILGAYGVEPSTVEIISTAETNEAIDAVQQGTVDGAVLPGAAGSGNFVELAQNTDVRWIDLSERIDEIVGIMGPEFKRGSIPAGTYEGQDQEIIGVGLPNITIVRADVPEETVYTMTKAILENPETLEQAHPLGGGFSVESTTGADPTIPFHPGAIQYYEEVGAWTEEMQQTQDESLR